jgi:GNAT superfamily N-acetyltransferase
VAVELVPVPLKDRRLVERFIRVPWFIHREHCPSPRWVPPLLMDRRDYLHSEKNPFFEHAEAAFWLAVKDGKDVGRIAAVEDADWAKCHGERVGQFGFFESPDDPEVASALLEQACEWARARGLTRVIGPLDLSTNYLSGVLVDSFDREPGVNMPYNPPYYGARIEACGFRKAKDLWQWAYDLSTPIPDRILRIADKIRERENVKVRPLDFSNWDAEVLRTLDVYNDAWEQNWGFVPVGKREYCHIAVDLKRVLQPGLALMAEVDGKPVAFALTIMNVNPVLKQVDGRLFPTGIFRLLWGLKLRPRIDEGRLILLGIRAPYRRRGIDSLLFVDTYMAAKRAGWKGGEIGWTLEDNSLVNRAIEAMGGTRAATYRIFERDL